MAKTWVRKTTSIVLYLFVLGVFVFSLYKILTISGLVQKPAWGCVGGWCDALDRWCECGCVCPTRTPTLTSATPTMTLTPTPTFKEELTPTPTGEILSSPTPTPTSQTPPDDGRGGPGGGPVVPPHCLVPTPKAPVLIRVDRLNSEKAELVWSEVASATDYNISYGQESKNYIYGVPSTGKVIAYQVGGLTAGQQYCFVVRAINDCAPSDPSNEVCTYKPASAAVGQVLGAKTLAATGSFDFGQVRLVLLALGWLFLGVGLRKSFSKRSV